LEYTPFIIWDETPMLDEFVVKLQNLMPDIFHDDRE